MFAAPPAGNSRQRLRQGLSTTSTTTLFRLLAMTGMRRGEAVGLPWSDVKLSTARITVRQALAVTD